MTMHMRIPKNPEIEALCAAWKRDQSRRRLRLVLFVTVAVLAAILMSA